MTNSDYDDVPLIYPQRHDKENFDITLADNEVVIIDQKHQCIHFNDETLSITDIPINNRRFKNCLKILDYYCMLETGRSFRLPDLPEYEKVELLNHYYADKKVEKIEKILWYMKEFEEYQRDVFKEFSGQDMRKWGENDDLGEETDVKDQQENTDTYNQSPDKQPPVMTKWENDMHCKSDEEPEEEMQVESYLFLDEIPEYKRCFTIIPEIDDREYEKLLNKHIRHVDRDFWDELKQDENRHKEKRKKYPIVGVAQNYPSAQN